MNYELCLLVVGVLSAALDDVPVSLVAAYVEVAPAGQSVLLEVAEVAGSVVSFYACWQSFLQCFFVGQLCDGLVVYVVAEIGLFGVWVGYYHAAVVCVEVAQFYLVFIHRAEFGHQCLFFFEEAYQPDDEV